MKLLMGYSTQSPSQMCHIHEIEKVWISLVPSEYFLLEAYTLSVLSLTSSHTLLYCSVEETLAQILLSKAKGRVGCEPDPAQRVPGVLNQPWLFLQQLNDQEGSRTEAEGGTTGGQFLYSQPHSFLFSKICWRR